MSEPIMPQAIIDLCKKYSNPALEGGKEVIMKDQAQDDVSLVEIKSALSRLSSSLNLQLSTLYPGLQKYVADSEAANNRFMKRRELVKSLFNGSQPLIEILALNKQLEASQSVD